MKMKSLFATIFMVSCFSIVVPLAATFTGFEQLIFAEFFYLEIFVIEIMRFLLNLLFKSELDFLITVHFRIEPK